VDDVTFIARRLHLLRENEIDLQLTLDDLADEVLRREARLAETFDTSKRGDLADQIASRVDQLGPLLARLDGTRAEIVLAESLAAWLAS
jgi:hypothetical protein